MYGAEKEEGSAQRSHVQASVAAAPGPKNGIVKATLTSAEIAGTAQTEPQDDVSSSGRYRLTPLVKVLSSQR